MNWDEEWIITNRNGSYSSSSASMANLRTYHGIFVRNINEKYERFVLLSKLFEEVEADGNSVSLDSNYYRNIVHPQGYKYLISFEKSPIPTFRYYVLGIKIEKSIVIDPYDDLLLINYKFSGKKPEKFRLYPLVSFRSYHNTIRHNEREIDLMEDAGKVRLAWNDVHFWINIPGEFRQDKLWYYNFRYPLDEARGSNCEEDLYLPGHFEVTDVPDEITVLVSAEKDEGKKFSEVEKKYLSSLSSVKSKDARIASLVNESTKLLVARDIIAGYYWFGPWSRDAFISLPGLLLIPGRYREARDLILNYADKLKSGFIPKTASQPDDLGAADSPLWFIYAVYKYFQYSLDEDLPRALFPKLVEILDSYLNGNELLDVEDSLVSLKKPQLTWMDAKTGDIIFTPRTGKPVEINALWFNALQTVKYFSSKFKFDLKININDLIDSVKDSFSEKFVRGSAILDVSDPDDFSVRPNAILAFSLPFPVLENFGDYVDFFSDLVTPFGLRSLSPKDSRYIGKYEGDQYKRDLAYHNGSVWPWLTGPYITASVRSGASRESLLSYFRELYSLKYVPEIFDGDPSYAPKGCIIQAWSYAELIRAYFEDLRRKR
ncbi:MAG: amylo-alpha-1,6-glucosidase [Thermoplasmatales archaeon]